MIRWIVRILVSGKRELVHRPKYILASLKRERERERKREKEEERRNKNFFFPLKRIRQIFPQRPSFPLLWKFRLLNWQSKFTIKKLLPENMKIILRDFFFKKIICTNNEICVFPSMEFQLLLSNFGKVPQQSHRRNKQSNKTTNF